MSTDPTEARDPSPAAPLAQVLAMLRSIEGVSVSPGRGTVVLARGADEEDLRIHVDEDPLTLADMNFEGNTEIAILALHALSPAFGAAELRDDDYTDVIDTSRPVADAVKQYRAKARADAAKIHAMIGGVDAGDDRNEAPPIRRSRRIALLALIVVIAIALPLFALWWFKTSTQRAPVGAACTGNAQCDSRECLSSESYEPASQNDGSPMMRARKSITNGACTQSCTDDTGCPRDMACAEALQDLGMRVPHRTMKCRPRSWP